MSLAGVNWDAVLAIAQIVGDVGVLFSLIYVGLQIRNDARARRAQTMHEQASSYTSILAVNAANPQLTDVVVRGHADINALKGPAELSQYFSIIGATFRAFEDAYFQHLVGDLDQRVWRGFEQPLVWNLKNPGVRACWSFAKAEGFYSPEFERFVDDKLRDIERGLAPAGQSPPAATAGGSTT